LLRRPAEEGRPVRRPAAGYAGPAPGRAVLRRAGPGRHPGAQAALAQAGGDRRHRGADQPGAGDRRGDRRPRGALARRGSAGRRHAGRPAPPGRHRRAAGRRAGAAALPRHAPQTGSVLRGGRAVRRWLAVVVPPGAAPAGAVLFGRALAALFLYGKAVTGAWPDAEARSPLQTLLIGAAVGYGAFRVGRFHPICRPPYRQWLATTP